jgi:hypothetical protein
MEFATAESSAIPPHLRNRPFLRSRPTQREFR